MYSDETIKRLPTLAGVLWSSRPRGVQHKSPGYRETGRRLTDSRTSTHHKCILSVQTRICRWITVRSSRYANDDMVCLRDIQVHLQTRNFDMITFITRCQRGFQAETWCSPSLFNMQRDAMSCRNRLKRRASQDGRTPALVAAT